MSIERLALLTLIAAILLCAPSPARAQPQGNGPSAEAAALAAKESKELNRNGIAMLDAGDLERALNYFMRSRAVLATTKNTTNTALALDMLGRHDESLELYEELLLKYAGGLDDQDRAAIAPAMEALRKKVGGVSVSSNAGGEVFIDGRSRGKLPVLTPIRVLPGKHALRVARVAYADFETEFSIEAGKVTTVTARLTALDGVGQLLVENVEGSTADVFVDGAKLGTTPWEGALPNGQHQVWLRVGEDRGSAPTVVQVLAGQAALTRLQTLPLTPEITIRVEPPSATFDIGGVSLGSGSWRGRLPVGPHVLSAAEAGYRSSRLELELSDRSSDVTVQLEIDPDHPRWQKAGSFVLEAQGGALIGPSLKGGYATDCPDHCESYAPAFGFQVGARGGYRFPLGFAVELGAGYMSLFQDVRRRETSTFGAQDTTVNYQLEDSVHVHGPFLSAGASWRAKLGSVFFAGTRVSAGVLVAISSDPVTGTAFTDGPSLPLIVVKGQDAVISPSPFVAPELLGGVRLGPVDLGLSLAAVFFPAQGARLERGRVGVDRSASEGRVVSTSVEKAKESDVIEGERAHGRFLLFSPTVSVGAAF